MDNKMILEHRVKVMELQTLKKLQVKFQGAIGNGYTI